MDAPPPADAWEAILDGRRGMWSTASLFAAAGLTVTREGDIVPACDSGDSAVFRLKPIQVTCADDGRTTWRELLVEPASDAGQSAPRWMLSIADVPKYPAAMTRSVQTLFKT